MSSPRLISCNVSSRSVALMASISPMAFATIGTQYLFELIERLLQLPQMANLPYHALKTNVFLKAFHYGKGSFTTETYLTKAEIRWILLRACTRLPTYLRQATPSQLQRTFS